MEILSQCHVETSSTLSSFFSALPGDEIYYNASEIEIKRGHFWVEGDNKKESYDSREFGQIPIGLLQGKVVSRLIPPKLKL